MYCSVRNWSLNIGLTDDTLSLRTVKPLTLNANVLLSYLKVTYSGKCLKEVLLEK